MRNISPRQEAICAFIAAFLRAEQWPPSVREIGAAFDLPRPSNVLYHLAILEREGLLERGKGARCIRLTSAGQSVAVAYLARVERKEQSA